MGCLSEDSLLALASGALAPQSLDDAQHHLDGCARCRQLVAVVASGGSTAKSGDPPRADDSLPIGRGTTIGRYVVTSVVGAGGMGAVYAAHDPELDRRVAIKVLHPRQTDPDDPARERLRREAQAMARLVHPNVVQVYDVGDHGNRTFIAMELVEGQTLRAWLNTPRSAAEIVAAFVEAGRGLSAAHEAGLLHRDFKPDNVFVAADGRVKVGDFGLARPQRTEPAAQMPFDSAARDTSTEGICGTPAYLAPEVMAGFPPSVASDLFSFCVALWEGLHRQRPFRGATAFALLQEARAARVQPASAAGVPSRVRRAVRRGLHADPAERPASVAALIDDLQPRRRGLLHAAAVASAVGLAVAALGLARPAFAARCSGAAADLAPAWSEARKAALARVFQAAGQQCAWNAIVRALDGFGASWVDVHTRSCRATRQEGHQAEDVMERRMRCLSRQREVVAALGDLWLSGREPMLANAPAAAASLPVPARCGGDGPLNAASLAGPPPGSADRVAEVQLALSEVDARLAAGETASALSEAREAAKSARRLAYPPLEAEALLELGKVLKERGEFEEAERTLQDATLAAVAAGHDRALAEAMVLLARVVGMSQARVDDGEVLLSRAEPVVARLGDRLLSSDLEVVRGNLRLARSDPTGARSIFAAVLPGLRELVGPDHPALAEVEHGLFLAAFDLGRLDEARQHAETTLSLLERSLPPEHVRLYPALMDLAATETGMGRLAQAHKLYERASRVAEKAQGADSPLDAAALGQLAAVMANEGDIAGARAVSERALRIAVARGPTHPFTAYMQTAMGERAWQAGLPEVAMAHLQRALELRQARYG
ncbi:MAG TPA: serine/threonine-protein kinase, partial [Myxococcales bacterium]|nr:serine/threonine-protein kinase [Myxococcales bacterium]